MERRESGRASRRGTITREGGRLTVPLLVVGLIAAAIIASRVADFESTDGRVRGAGSPRVLASGDVLGDPRLTWSPPVLRDPLTVHVDGKGTKLDLDPARDYSVVMPSTPVTAPDGLRITGGHNVVVVGGTIDTPPGKSTGATRRAGLILTNWTGTMHVEGLAIRGDLLEGIDANTSVAGTVLQLEMVRVEKVHGSYDTNHADVLQFWSAPTVVRVDRLTGATDYQGFFFNPNDPEHDHEAPTREIDIRRTDLHLVDDGATGYLYYAAGDPFPLRCSKCFADAPSRRFPDMVVNDKWQRFNAAEPVVDGSPGGSFVPPDLVGAGYRGPGYVS